MRLMLLSYGATLFVLSAAVAAIIKNEYVSWASRLARLILRAACWIQPERREEWIAEIGVAQDAKESGLGDAFFYCLGSMRYTVLRVYQRTSRRRPILARPVVVASITGSTIVTSSTFRVDLNMIHPWRRRFVMRHNCVRYECPDSTLIMPLNSTLTIAIGAELPTSAAIVRRTS